MKRMLAALLCLLFTVGLLFTLCSCTEQNSGVNVSDGSASGNASAGTDEGDANQPRPVTYAETVNNFSRLRNEKSHVEYVNYVYSEAEKLKEKAEIINDEIVELLKAEHASLTEIRPELSFDTYCEKYIRPYEEYYKARMEAAQLSENGYLGVYDVKIALYGGNSSPDATAHWEYVHYNNLYCELYEIKKHLE